MADERPDITEPLTSRELEILGLIAEGLTNHQIASRLFLTVSTVKWYNQQSFQKLGVGNRTQALARARELGLFGGTAPAAKPNLPAQSTAFVGRSAELADIQTRLANPTCRLLTLVGPGGIGKTRLAIEAAQQQQTDFPDGVYFVPLASIEATTFIPQALADALHLVQISQQDPLAQIMNALREKRVLLVIDNFEHLLEGADLLAELLEKSVQVKLLVTSRERLHLKGEWVFDVPGLHYATADRLTPPADLLHYEATQLFVQTAKRVRPDFSADTVGLAQVAQICQLVGGMPLGIELSASWVRALSCGEISREIEHGLDILKTTWRDVPERHRSIRAVLDHSWKMLTEAEQQTFAGLTVFSGSFQRPAAEAVTGTALTTLLNLVDKSCLQRVGSDRFVVHELLRQYGADKLRHNEDRWIETRRQHCRYYASFLYERMTALDPAGHLEEVEPEFDNIQAAWRYAVGQQQRDEIRALALGFLEYYNQQSWYRAGSDAIGLYQRTLATFAADTADSRERATIACLHESLGHLRELSGDGDQALTYYRQALAFTDPTNALQQGHLHRALASVYVVLNDPEKADRACAQAETILEQAGERTAAWWQEWTSIQLQHMNLYYWANRLEDMIDLNRRIGALIAQHAVHRLRIRYLFEVANIAYRRERYFHPDDAITASSQALALSLKTGNLKDIAEGCFQLGFSYLWSDQLEEAEKYLRRAWEITQKNGDLPWLARALTYLAIAYRKRGDVAHVRDFAEDAMRAAAEAHMPRYTGMAHAEYAWISWREGDIAGTLNQSHAAIGDWQAIGERVFPAMWLVLFPLLGVALQQADTEQGVTLAQQLILPSCARLPDDLTQLLERAVAAWGQNLADVTSDLLQQAFQLAQSLGYV